MSEVVVLREATFNPKVRDYWLLSGAVILVCTCIFSPLAIIWFLAGRAITQRYLDNMSCVLTERSLKVKKGLFVKQEKTVPLDKITDLAMVQGPIMRSLDIEALSVETAGGSSPGALVTLVGVENAREFRDAVLAQRDQVTSAAHEVGEAPRLSAAGGDAEVLGDIRDSLKRIEEMMKRREQS